MDTNYYPTAIRMRCIRAVCLLLAMQWGFSEPAQAVGFRMKSVSPEFLLSGASADAGTFQDVNSISATLYFTASRQSVPISARRLSDRRMQSFGGGTYATPHYPISNTAAGSNEWVSSGGGVVLSSQQFFPSEEYTDMPAEEMPAAAMQEEPRQAVAYSNSRYYTVASQQRPAAGTAAYPVYRPMLTQVGAQTATAMAWTSESNAAPMRRANNANDDGWTDPSDPNQSDKSPVGEAWALLAFSAAYAGYTFLHKKKAESENLNNSTF